MNTRASSWAWSVVRGDGWSRVGQPALLELEVVGKVVSGHFAVSEDLTSCAWVDEHGSEVLLSIRGCEVGWHIDLVLWLVGELLGVCWQSE